MSGGDEICSKLRASGVCPKAVSILWSSLETERNFLDLVPSLDNVLVNIDTISSSTVICTEHNKRLIGN